MRHDEHTYGAARRHLIPAAIIAPTAPRADGTSTSASGACPLRCRDVELAFDDAGTGPCVLLIHGHPFDRSLWRPQVDVLATKFRVVAPDLRGFGASPVTPYLVTLRAYARDVE
jgi:pimeloyl-ACP methyl ester carboxylesterase